MVAMFGNHIQQHYNLHAVMNVTECPIYINCLLSLHDCPTCSSHVRFTIGYFITNVDMIFVLQLQMLFRDDHILEHDLSYAI